MTATILLIDDNAVQAATRQTILKRAGYFVIAALNPARASPDHDVTGNNTRTSRS